MRELTQKQQAVLEEVRRSNGRTAREITDDLDQPAFKSQAWSQAEVRSVLRALQRRELVWRSETSPRRWSA